MWYPKLLSEIFSYIPYPFRESGTLWTKTPYFVWAIVNLAYTVLWAGCALLLFDALIIGAIIGAPSYAIGKVSWTISHILWISLTRKDGTAKSEMHDVWKESGLQVAWDTIWQIFDFSECTFDLPISRRASWMD